ncbi:MAG: MauE/DoxX family redox-associated membrane protein [Candidatus Omnitrophota bacterium]|nr:MauE/DoxX family redox-associated membrane protein [Candidatus Omnitrophota bacterium]
MIFPLLRIVVGSVLLVSGLEKAIHPYQNFLYVVQAYQMLPGWAETLTAVVAPWVELMIGLFLVLGLWTMKALRWALMLFAVFIVVVGQALLRGLPLDHCGCFGSWVQVTPQQIIVFDSFCFLVLMVLLRNLVKTQRFSLDKRSTQR